MGSRSWGHMAEKNRKVENDRVLFDGVVRCVGVDKYYEFGEKKTCCYEPVPMFESGEDRSCSRSIPFLVKPSDFKKGRRYRISIFEVAS
jgi:hypothetical protein